MLPHHLAFVDRFIAACQADSRVVAALLFGSYAKGLADSYSDLDLCVVTTDAAHEGFVATREEFLQQLGDLVFLEDFDIPGLAFYIFADGVEGELYFRRASEIRHTLDGPYQVLLDKTGLLTEPVTPVSQPPPTNQTEILRRQIYWFWHELSHFITALGRGQLWWAYGQVEALRSICVNLVRLRHNFAHAEVGDEPFFKVENAIPIEQLTSLQTTICPMEREPMLSAVFVILRFYQPLAMSLAQMHGLQYPLALERVMVERLARLSA